MTNAANIIPLAGMQSVGNWYQPDTTQRHPLGMILNVVDPYWGGQEVMYVAYSFTNGTALQVGAIMAYDSATSFTATLLATATLSGKALGFVLNGIPSTSATGTYYLWVVIAGQCPIWSSASIAANTALSYGGVAGQARASTISTAILNCRVTLPATTAVTKVNSAPVNGTKIVRVANTDGYFIGVSTTGVTAAASLIVAIDPDNRTLTLAANCNTSAAVSLVGTYNDATNFFNVVTCNRPMAQGPIT